MKIILLRHAKEQCKERGIEENIIEETVLNPGQIIEEKGRQENCPKENF